MRNKRKSLGQIARDIGVSKSYLSMILNGHRRLTPELAKKLQQVPGVHKFVNFQAYEVPSKQVVVGSSPISRSID